MVALADIEHRYSCLTPGSDPDRLDDDGFYRRGAFPDTSLRMARYDREALPLANSSWFIQAQAQLAMNSRADFKPGKQLGIDLGYRYDATDKLGLMLQLNYHVKDRDSGAEAEPEDSGSRNLSLSPGVSYAFAKGAQIYAFLQKPIYQSVNGVQLTAEWSAVAGVSAKF